MACAGTPLYCAWQVRFWVAGMLSQLFDDAADDRRGKVAGIYAILVTANIAVWLWAFWLFRDSPLLLGTAFLAYSFGLRHAFDADHIAAIDNVTRKMMQEGRYPIAAGFFFSLGHSTIVVGLALAVALTTTALQGHFAALRDIGALIGTSVSALFLFAIAFANILVLVPGLPRLAGRAGRTAASTRMTSITSSANAASSAGCCGPPSV